MTTTTTTTTTTASDAEWQREVKRRQIQLLPDLRDRENHRVLYFSSLTPQAAERSDRGLQRQVSSEPASSSRRSKCEAQRREDRGRSSSMASVAEAKDRDAGRRPETDKKNSKKNRQEKKEKKASVWSFSDFDMKKHQASAVQRFAEHLAGGQGRSS
jgi:hypothetical protein